MSAELKAQNDALRKKLLEMKTQAAAAGIPLSTGGLDLGTGERVPAHKFLGLEFGDATPYAERQEALLNKIQNVGGQIADYNAEQSAQTQAASDKRMAEILAGYQTDPAKIADTVVDIETRLDPIYRQRADEAVNRSIRQNQLQMASALPFLDLAGQRATERNLNASQRYLDFKERMPTAIQNRMLMGSTAYAQELGAVAQAATAAANMARSGTGRRFG